MNCAEYVKSKGVKSLKDVSKISGVMTRTLQNWYKTRRFVFDAVIEKVKNN